MGQPFQPARQTREIGKRLVMQVHADALALGFQRLGQLQRSQPQPLLPGARLGLDDGGTLGLLGGSQGKEIGRQQIGDRPALVDVSIV